MIGAGILGSVWLWTLVAARVAIVSSSQVAAGQPPLRYADRDAERMASLLTELGGFERVILVKNIDANALRHAFAQAEQIAPGGGDTQLFVYYSGHADQTGLLLGDDHFTFRELRQRLESSSAAVRVAMLDACHAGQAVNAKGVHVSSAFGLPAEATPQVKGAAILAASAASELAQESSELGGSYFTHHVLSALRGAGDANDDGAVTLQEAYEYAYGRTVASTMPNFFGSQHPTFEYKLAGTGALVLTRFLGRAQVVVGQGQDTSYLLANAFNEVVAEIPAHPKRNVRIALPPGSYRVLRRQQNSTYTADAVVPTHGEVHLDKLTFKPVPPDLALAKGGLFRRTQDFRLSYGIVAYAPGVLGASGEVDAAWMRRGLLWSWGPSLSYGQRSGSWSEVPYEVKRIHLSGDLLRRIPLGFSEVAMGIRVGVMAIQQRLGQARSGSGGPSGGEPSWGFGPAAFAVMQADVPLAPWASLRLEWSLGGVGLKVNDSIRVHPEVQSSLGLAFFF